MLLIPTNLAGRREEAVDLIKTYYEDDLLFPKDFSQELWHWKSHCAAAQKEVPQSVSDTLKVCRVWAKNILPQHSHHFAYILTFSATSECEC